MGDRNASPNLVRTKGATSKPGFVRLTPGLIGETLFLDDGSLVVGFYDGD